jgi:RNA polymerase sigma-70 factor (ECF subfamily)
VIVSSLLRLVASRDMDERPVDPRVEALRAGERAAVEAVLGELLPEVRRQTFRLLGPRHDLDDAVQDALVEIAKALPRYEGRASLTTFAHQITVRVAYRYFGGGAKRRGETSLELVPPPLDTLDPESVAMSREALRRLYRCLDRLPKKRRVAFVLCGIEGLTPLEAGAIAGTRASVIRSRFHHARREVARMLSGDPYVRALSGEEAPS